jgi:hypothetical protein
MRSWVISKMGMLKAWVGAVTAAGGVFLTAVADGAIDGTEVGLIVGAFLAALGLVYRVPNKE